MKKDFNRLVAYIIVPLIFTLAGVGVCYLGLNGIYKNGVKDVKALLDKNTANITSEVQPASVEVDEVPLYGAFYANVYIERFNYASKIYYGCSDRLMKKGICQEYGGTLLGFNGKTILTADTHGAFWVLEDLQVGDVLTVETAYGKFGYEVIGDKIGYAMQDIDSIKADGEVLVMYGKLPFKSNHKTVVEEEETDVKGTHKIVWAKKISGPDAALKEGV